MPTWLHHIILLVITSNNISLSPQIAFIYHLVFDGLLFWYTVMSWSRNPITWSHLSSSNDIPLSLHPLTILSLLTSHLIFLSWNIALIRSTPARITSRFLQPNSNPYQHLLLDLDLSTSETIRELDYLTKLCDWGRHTKQNQPRMVLVRRT